MVLLKNTFNEIISVHVSRRRGRETRALAADAQLLFLFVPLPASVACR